MAKFTPYALAALPTTGIDVNGIYFIKGASDTVFKVYIRENDNSDWINLGTVAGIDSINGFSSKNVQLDLTFVAGVLGMTGSSITFNLDARYALDNAVVKLSGNQTIGGVKTFSMSPIVPTATTAHQAIRKEQVDSAVNDLQGQINIINAAIGSALRYKGDINASTNPNYPAATVGDTYVISAAGRIGGASGIEVSVGNTIICKTDTAAGAQAAVGANWTVLQADLNYATESVPGVVQIASQAEVNAGSNGTKMVTPLTLQTKMAAGQTAIESWANDRFVRYDSAAQGLDPSEKQNARTNIDAASLSDIEWGAKEW